MKYIRTLYQIETELSAKELSDEQFTEQRRGRVEPVLEAFREWLNQKSETVFPSSLVGKAVEYTLSQWDKLVRYLDRADLTPDNNAAERSIKPFVIGRQNFLFSGSPRGAAASCNVFSIVGTAKQNGMNPYGYLYYILSRLPEVESTGKWKSLLPSQLDPQENNTAFLADVR